MNLALLRKLNLWIFIYFYCHPTVTLPVPSFLRLENWIALINIGLRYVKFDIFNYDILQASSRLWNLLSLRCTFALIWRWWFIQEHEVQTSVKYD